MSKSKHEEDYISLCRRRIEEQYDDHPTGCGGSFGEILCYELHVTGLTFTRLAEKWGISLPTLGDLIADHCNQLQELPQVNHDYHGDAEPVNPAVAQPSWPTGYTNRATSTPKPPEAEIVGMRVEDHRWHVLWKLPSGAPLPPSAKVGDRFYFDDERTMLYELVRLVEDPAPSGPVHKAHWVAERIRHSHYRSYR